MKLASIFGILLCGLAAAAFLGVPAPAVESGRAAALGLVAGSLVAAVGQRASTRLYRKILLCAGFLLLAVMPWWRGGIAVSAAIGFGAGAVFAVANLLVRAAGPQPRGSALATLHLFFPAALLLAAVASPGQYTGVTAAVAALGLIFAVLLPPQPAGPTDDAPDRPALLSTALVLFLYMFSEGALWNGLPWYLAAARVIDPDSAIRIRAYALPLGLLVGRAGCVRLLAGLPPRTVLRYTPWVMVFTTALLLLARSPSASWLAAGCLGISMAPILPAALAMAGESSAWVLAIGWIGLAAGWSAMTPDAVRLLPLVSLTMIAAAAFPRRR